MTTNYHIKSSLRYFYKSQDFRRSAGYLWGLERQRQPCSGIFGSRHRSEGGYCRLNTRRPSPEFGPLACGTPSSDTRRRTAFLSQTLHPRVAEGCQSSREQHLRVLSHSSAWQSYLYLWWLVSLLYSWRNR